MDQIIHRVASMPGLLALMLALVAAPAASGQTLPNNDAILDHIIQLTEPYSGLIQLCQQEACPEFDCQAAHRAFVRLRDARKILEHHHYWWKRLARTQRDVLEAHIEQGLLTTEQVASLQYLVAYQEWVVNTAGLVIDLATGAEGLKDALSDPKKLEDLTGWEFVDRVDGIYEAIKDIESATNTILKGSFNPDADPQSAIGINLGDLDAHKSTLSDLKTVVQQAIENGESWRGALEKKQGRLAILAIVGRYSKMWADAEIAERQEKIAQLQSDLAASDLAQSGAFDDLGPLLDRRYKAEDAYLAVHELIVVEGDRPTFTACLATNRGRCGQLDLNYVSDLEVPEEYRFDHYDILEDAGDLERSPLKALEYFSQRLVEVPPLLASPPEFRRAYASISLPESSYEPGETLTATFTAPSCYASNAWVGVVPASVEHGFETINSNNALSGRSFLRNRREGEMSFQAPDELGRYDLRMNDPESNTEVASTWFQVTGEEPFSDGTLLIYAHHDIGHAGLGISLNKGDVLTVTVQQPDRWSAGDDDPVSRTTDANGLTSFETLDRMGISARYGALVGRIGGGRPFVVGDAYRDEVGQGGDLELFFWDDHYSDNTGAIGVLIEIEPAAPDEPREGPESDAPESDGPADPQPEEDDNLVQNGSFESGPPPGGYLTLGAGSTAIAHWQVTRATVDYIGTHFPSGHGSRHIDLDGSPGHGGIRQTFTTQPGQRYRLSFLMAGNNQGPPEVKRMRVTLGSANWIYTHAAGLSWTERHLEFEASGSSTTLIIQSANQVGDAFGALIDGVRVVKVHKEDR